MICILSLLLSDEYVPESWKGISWRQRIVREKSATAKREEGILLKGAGWRVKRVYSLGRTGTRGFISEKLMVFTTLDAAQNGATDIRGK